MDLHTIDTAWQAWEAGKSIGRFGTPNIDIRGCSPFCVTNSRQWSSVELLLKMDSTNFIYRRYKYYLTIKEQVCNQSSVYAINLSKIRCLFGIFCVSYYTNIYSNIIYRVIFLTNHSVTSLPNLEILK
jgi:hypothetical protein